jgi:hypothetical protein
MYKNFGYNGRVVHTETSEGIRYFVFVNDEYLNDYKKYSTARGVLTRKLNALVNARAKVML